MRQILESSSVSENNLNNHINSNMNQIPINNNMMNMNNLSNVNNMAQLANFAKMNQVRAPLSPSKVDPLMVNHMVQPPQHNNTNINMNNLLSPNQMINGLNNFNTSNNYNTASINSPGKINSLLNSPVNNMYTNMNKTIPVQVKSPVMQSPVMQAHMQSPVMQSPVMQAQMLNNLTQLNNPTEYKTKLF